MLFAGVIVCCSICKCCLQASCQNDLENWIRAIHSACASSYARQHGKDNTLKLLKSELEKLEANIDTVRISLRNRHQGRKEMFYLTTHSTHFIYCYMASDIW